MMFAAKEIRAARAPHRQLHRPELGQMDCRDEPIPAIEGAHRRCRLAIAGREQRGACRIDHDERHRDSLQHLSELSQGGVYCALWITSLTEERLQKRPRCPRLDNARESRKRIAKEVRVKIETRQIDWPITFRE